MNKKTMKGYLFPTILLVISLFLDIGGLEKTGVRALGVLAFAISSWLLVPRLKLITSVAVIILLPLFKILTFEQSLEGFGESATWLLISTFVISEALSVTGLDKRLAFLLIRMGGNRKSNVLLATLVTSLVFVFIVPSAAGRMALIIPVCRGICHGINSKKEDDFNKAIYIGVTYQSLVASSATMTGSLSVVFAIGLFETLLNYHWNYLDWVLAFLPIVIINTFGLWFVLRILYLSRSEKQACGEDFARKKLQELGIFSKAEKKLCIILIGMLLLWFSSWWHGYSVAFVALFCAFIMSSPGIGVLNIDKTVASIDLKIMVMFATSLSLASSLNHSGVIKWIQDLGGMVNLQHIHPLLLVIGMMLVLALFRMGFVSVLSMSATFLPLTIALMNSWGYNPIWGGCVAVIAFSLCLLFPTQSVSGMIAFSTEEFSMQEMLKSGLIFTAVVITVTSFVAVYYWPLVGITMYK